MRIPFSFLFRLTTWICFSMTHEIERHRKHISPDLPFRFESLNVRSKYQTHSVSNRLLNSGVLRFGPFVRAFSYADLHAFQDKVYIV